MVITNPPFLSKSSASRLGIEYPKTNHNDIYKLCLELMLNNCSYVASIVPDSFLTSNFDKSRLVTYISLTNNHFDNTVIPVGLALFNKDVTKDFLIYRDNKILGSYLELKEFDLDMNSNNLDVTFNNPNGELGLISIDNTTDKIRFINGTEIDPKTIKHYSRAYSRISIKGNYNLSKLINNCNQILDKYRTNTKDVFLTSFKSVHNDGTYRRRLDFDTARRIINKALL